MLLAIWFCSSSLKQLGKFHNHTVWVSKKHWLGSFAWRAIVCTTKVRMKLLEMGKDMKIKHSVSSPKCMGRLFLKNSLHGGANSLGQIYGGMFYMETNDQIKQRRRKSFTSAFSSNLNTANLRLFPGHGRRHTWT